MKVYRRIRDLREDRDLTQTQLGKHLGIAQRTYSNYECGERTIPTELLIQLAQFYNTSIDYLVGMTEEKRPYPRVKR